MASKHMKNDKNNKRKNSNINNKRRPTNASRPIKKTKGPYKKQKKQHKVAKRIIVIIVIILIILAGIFASKVVINGGGVRGILATLFGQSEEERKSMSEIQFLILGESLNLTDTIMIGRYNPNTQKAALISVQRDTFIGDNPKRATAYDKINSVYQGKYPEKTLKEVNELTGLNLEYYVVVDTKGLRELVDAIGGVEFEVPIDMKYDDTSQDLHINLKKGLQKLNGDQAEQVLRFRHNNDGTTYPASYGTQDTGRMKTQRAFISALLKQTLKPSNIFKIGEFIDIANENIKTNIPIEVLKDYIPYAVEFSTDNLQTATLPGEPKEMNGVWLYLTDDDESQEMIAQYFFDCPSAEELGLEDDEDEESNSTENTTTANTENLKPTLQILNGTSDFSLLKEVVNKYKEQGYNILKVGNTESKAKQTKITNRTKQDSATVTAVKNIIKETAKTETGKDNEDVDFTITIGQDYKN